MHSRLETLKPHGATVGVRGMVISVFFIYRSLKVLHSLLHTHSHWDGHGKCQQLIKSDAGASSAHIKLTHPCTFAPGHDSNQEEWDSASCSRTLWLNMEGGESGTEREIFTTATPENIHNDKQLKQLVYHNVSICLCGPPSSLWLLLSTHLSIINNHHTCLPWRSSYHLK